MKRYISLMKKKLIKAHSKGILPILCCGESLECRESGKALEFVGGQLKSALAGYLAGKVMKGGGFGFWVNLIVGIVGGFIGGNVLAWFGINWGASIIGQIVTAVIGSIILLWVISLFKK